MDSAIVLALIGIIGAVVTALFKLLNDNTAALERLAASSDKIAEATATGNLEAKQRNGHLGEQNIQIAQLVASQSTDVSDIQLTSRANSDTNARVEKLLLSSANTLIKTEAAKDAAATAVKDALEN